MISTVTTTTTTVTTAQVITYSIISIITLVAFLTFKEILSAEANKSIGVRSFVKGTSIAIIPLLFVFVAIVAYKVLTV